MSQFEVRPVRIAEVKPHPDADTLEIAMIEGSMYQVIVRKDWCHTGDVKLYVPLDAVIPVEVSDHWGVTSYLSKGRVRAAKLRGQTSYGFLTDVEDIHPSGFHATHSGEKFDWNGWCHPNLGDDVSEFYGITKYIPPITLTCGEAAGEVEVFPRYTDIENIHNFPELFKAGENVRVTEKLHGMNCRVGLVTVLEEEILTCGSHNHRRRLGTNSTYELPLKDKAVVALLENYRGKGVNVVLYGEIYGGNAQKGFNYGEEKPVFRAFDISINGTYLNAVEFEGLCDLFGVQRVPVLYEGPFDPDVIRQFVDGKSTLTDGHIREGVVIRPLIERFDPSVGRVILKWKSDDYLTHKHGV